VTSPYSPIILEHFRRPRNFGALPGATVVREANNPLCGDRVRIALLVNAGTIADARFGGDACAICVASASLLTERVRGMTAVEAGGVTEAETIAALQTAIDPTRRRCALLPLEALLSALSAPPEGGSA
jgi:nitrogen fixation NifU-like protein